MTQPNDSEQEYESFDDLNEYFQNSVDQVNETQADKCTNIESQLIFEGARITFAVSMLLSILYVTVSQV